MPPELLDFLACPTCGGHLHISAGLDAKGHVSEGELSCAGCHARYAVRNGIPRMLAPLSGPEARHNDHDRVDLTVSQYSAYQGEVYAPMAECLANEAILHARTGLESSDYAGRVCLDAGCGIARFSRVMARAGARLVIALDAGNSIDAARERTPPELPIAFVQGHILQMPLKPRCIDRAISIGVLHHTADPEKGFRSVAATVKPQGSLSIYLYTRTYLPWQRVARIPFWQIRFALWTEPMRRLIVHLPNAPRLAFCKALYALRMGVIEPLKNAGPLGRLLARAVQFLALPDIYKPLENAESNIARNFDAYSTPYNYSHELEELVDWFGSEPGFNRLLVTPYRLSITGWRMGDETAGSEPLQVTLQRAASIADLEARGVEHQPSR